MVTVQQLLLKVPSIKTSLGVVGMITSHSFLRQAPAEVNTTIYYIDQNGYIAGFEGDEITNETNAINLLSVSILWTGAASDI